MDEGIANTLVSVGAVFGPAMRSQLYGNNWVKSIDSHILPARSCENPKQERDRLPLHMGSDAMLHMINPPGPDDNTLIKMALAGETECFSVLMDRHLGALKRCIGSMVRNSTDAEDLVQDVLLKIWRRLSTYRSEAKFRTWMIRVAINEVFQSYRRERRNPLGQIREDTAGLASADESAYRCFARAEAKRAVRDALAQLPPRYREVLILRDLEQLTTEEAARSLQETVPTIKTRLFRARLMLAAALRGVKPRNPASAVRKTPIRKAA